MCRLLLSFVIPYSPKFVITYSIKLVVTSVEYLQGFLQFMYNMSWHYSSFVRQSRGPCGGSRNTLVMGGRIESRLSCKTILNSSVLHIDFVKLAINIVTVSLTSVFVSQGAVADGTWYPAYQTSELFSRPANRCVCIALTVTMIL